MPDRKTAAQLAEYRRKRDFARTKEPKGDTIATNSRGAGKSRLAYVIQKHAATQLHFDLRLELDGVMKSWAVPKGPSLDPSVKRLAMQVEDHPVEYNTFEGTIPEGEYGGGTVMLWDRGSYTYGGPPSDEEPEAALRSAYEKGDFKILLAGKRLRGSWVLVRMRRGDGRQWLLIKHRDEAASSDVDVVATYDTSVATGRTMEEIASEKSRVWRSKRGATSGASAAKKKSTAKKSVAKRSARKKPLSPRGA